jgi:enoyl-CoA hydratase/carnithine racemase
MPTVALVNGHCFGAGVFLAMACDYRVQNASKGFICLPEVDLGVPIPTSIAAMLRAKMPSLLVYRDAVIEGRRWSGEASLKAGLVDGIGGMDQCIQLIKDRKLAEKSSSGVVAALKEDQYRVVLIMFEREKDNVAWRVKMDEEREKRAEIVAQEVKDWKRSQL